MATETRDVTDLMKAEFHHGPMSIAVQSFSALHEAWAMKPFNDPTPLTEWHPPTQGRKQADKFHSLWFDSVEVLSATVNGNNVKVTWRFPVTVEYTNPAKLLHGAAQALFGKLASS